MKFIACKLPMRFIKERFLEEAKSHAPPSLSHDRLMEVWNAGIETIRIELDNANSEEELDAVLRRRGRISLHEWIESL